MSTALPIVLLIVFTCFTSHVNAIRCYFCFGTCSNPFNRTNPNTTILDLPTGWCMKAKLSNKRGSGIIRSPDSFGACSQNGCKSHLYKGSEVAGCCCNTDLCNHSHRTTKLSIGLLESTLLIGIMIILKS